MSVTASHDRAPAAIGFVLAAMLCISINDMLIKSLSGDYPLHQMVFVRSFIGVGASLLILRLEGGLRLLRTDQPALHALRALLIVFANMAFFAGLAVLPLGAATSIFFVAPLFITLLAIPVLGERAGPHRLGAIAAGFLGVAIMFAPQMGTADVPLGAMLLPVAAAGGYAGMQVLTRKLGARSAASAMAIYIQVTFLAVGGAFYLVAGDGRFADGVENASLQFLLRAWVWPATEDLWLFGVLGLMSASIGYTMSQAYRLAAPATVAPFEYSALPLAIFWGWVIFGERPGPLTLVGSALIAGAGLYVFARERQRGSVRRGPLRRA